jgi:hypothetical protein
MPDAKEKTGGEGSGRRPLPPELRVPHPARCDPNRPDCAEILARHTEAMAAERDTYVDPATGYQVWTARFLWERGYCCETGCRHCPWIRR